MREEQAAGPIPGIAARVREHRRRQGLTQAQLGSRVARSAMWVDRLEHGDLEWAARLERGLVELDEVPVLTDLAAALGVTAAELAGRPADALPTAAPPPRPAAAPRVAVAAPSVPRPPLPRLRRPGVPVRTLAAGAGIGIVVTAVAVGLGRAGGGGDRHPAGAAVAAAPALATASTGVPHAPEPTDPPAPSEAATPTAAQPTAAPRTPAPAPRPTARVVAVVTATPSPEAPSAVTVFPAQVLMVVPAGSRSNPTITFTIGNRDSAALSLGAVSLTNAGFQAVRDTCSRTTLAPGGSCNVTLRVAPPAAGRFTGALVVPVIDRTTSTVPLEVDAR